MGIGTPREQPRKLLRSPLIAADPHVRCQACQIGRGTRPFFYSGDFNSHVAEIMGVQSDAHFRSGFRERFGASPMTVGRSFQRK
jgi:hypothetical protein